MSYYDVDLRESIVEAALRFWDFDEAARQKWPGNEEWDKSECCSFNLMDAETFTTDLGDRESLLERLILDMT